MIEITIFQLWYLFDLKFDRLKEKKTNDIRPFCRWLKECAFSWRMDAAAGMLLNIPLHILEWGQPDIPPGPLTLAAGGVEEHE
jgi:hypothetical protein